MIHFQKIQGQFKPMYRADLEKWEKLKENTPYVMRAERDKNHRFHNKLFAVAQEILNNLPEGSPWENKTSYQLIKASMIPIGFVEEMVTLEGQVVLIPESISFEKCKQEKFEEIYEKMIIYWVKKFGDWVLNINEQG